MDPEQVLENPLERTTLLAVLNTLGQVMLLPNQRQGVFLGAGLVLPTVQVTDPPFQFAQGLLAAFIGRKISDEGADAHPMVRFCQYVLNNGSENFGLAAQDAVLLQNLIDQTRDRAAALLARRSVGRVEDALEQGIGTGAVIAPRTLLVCRHVISKTRVERAWVRFGYTSFVAGQDRNALFELDLSPSDVASGSHELDYALVRINGRPKQPILPTLLTELNSGDEVRMIHHPAGKPAVVSDVGRVTHVANDYILHDLPAEHGSSGAPIFNRHWQLVAIHRGESARVQPGTAEGLPLSAFWLELQKQFAPSTGF